MKKNKGITLIALVVTIIIMLILVGVVLSMIASGNGIFEKTEKAVEVTNNAAIKEEIEFAILEKMTEYYEDYHNLVGSYPTAMDYVKAQFTEGESLSLGAMLKYNESTEIFEYIKDGKMTEINVDEKGNVTIGEVVEASDIKYAVKYDANGGNGTPEDQRYKKGAEVSVNLSVTPTKEGYNFLGWTDDANDKNTAKYTKDGSKTFIMGEKNVTLYAVWKPYQVWTQDKTNVTDGTITLEVGTKVNGYEANGVSDWYVLGAENGKLLLMTNYSVGIPTFSGIDGYINGSDILNTAAAKYTNSDYAEGNARSVRVEDINRVTGYDPDVGGVMQWKNEVTYTNRNGTIYYKGTKYPETEKASKSSSFSYWTGEDLKLLEDGESVTLMSYYYWYDVRSLSLDTDDDLMSGVINGSELAYGLFYGDGSRAVICDDSVPSCVGDSFCWGYASFTRSRVIHSAVFAGFESSGQEFGVDSAGLRPVVSLQSKIKVGSDGTLSL